MENADGACAYTHMHWQVQLWGYVQTRELQYEQVHVRARVQV